MNRSGLYWGSLFDRLIYWESDKTHLRLLKAFFNMSFGHLIDSVTKAFNFLFLLPVFNFFTLYQANTVQW